MPRLTIEEIESLGFVGPEVFQAKDYKMSINEPMFFYQERLSDDFIKKYFGLRVLVWDGVNEPMNVFISDMFISGDDRLKKLAKYKKDSVDKLMELINAQTS